MTETKKPWMDMNRIKAEIARLEAEEEEWLRETGTKRGNSMLGRTTRPRLRRRPVSRK